MEAIFFRVGGSFWVKISITTRFEATEVLPFSWKIIWKISGKIRLGLFLCCFLAFLVQFFPRGLQILYHYGKLPYKVSLAWKFLVYNYKLTPVPITFQVYDDGSILSSWVSHALLPD